MSRPPRASALAQAPGPRAHTARNRPEPAGTALQGGCVGSRAPSEHALALPTLELSSAGRRQVARQHMATKRQSEEAGTRSGLQQPRTERPLIMAARPTRRESRLLAKSSPAVERLLRIKACAREHSARFRMGVGRVEGRLHGGAATRSSFQPSCDQRRAAAPFCDPFIEHCDP